jgi:hypothetical protein
MRDYGLFRSGDLSAAFSSLSNSFIHSLLFEFFRNLNPDLLPT